jgi:elongator complex protein 3
VPRWIRLNRIVRDIPATVIEGKFNEVNLYQRILKHMNDNSIKGTDIRFREIKLETVSFESCKLFTEIYESSEGTEYFISYETLNKESILGFIRVRINHNKMAPIFTELQNAVLIRELHVYGKMTKQGIADDKSNQHKGIGTMLLNEAEKIALKHNYTKIAVISGVGVREYYKKKGYRREGTFMIKTIPKMSLVKTNPLFINSSFETLFVKSLLYTSMIGMTLFGFM